jgi:hypothetical protein
MLMADFVGQGADGNDKTSKGVRKVGSSRDIFCNAGSTLILNFPGATSDWNIDSGVNTAVKFELPFFGDGCVFRWNNHTTYAVVNSDMKISDSLATTGNFSNLVAYVPSGSYNSTTGYLTPTGGTRYNDSLSLTGLGMGQHTIQAHGANNPTGNLRYRIVAFDVVSPIHTSSHYQTFETPFLHELVGGDRNMEQNNLVVTPDGKTWDEVTRDTSYIGNIVGSANHDGGKDWPNIWMMNKWRGQDDGRTSQDYVQKDFAIAYDRIIFLRSGHYKFNVLWTANGPEHLGILKNGVNTGLAYTLQTGDANSESWLLYLKKGDYVQMKGSWGTDMTYHGLYIERS